MADDIAPGLTETTTPKITAHDIRLALDAKYSGEAWIRLPEARAGLSWTGNDGQCDYLAIGAWQSTGTDPIGHEIKVRRADWLKELKDPSKAQRFMRYCSRWWLVVPAPWRDIVKPGELPDTWGLMELNGRGLRVTVQAPALEHAQVPWSWAVGWMATSQRVVSRVDDQTLAREFERGVREGISRTRNGMTQADATRLEMLAEFADRVSKATGGRVRVGSLTEGETERLVWARRVVDVLTSDGAVNGRLTRLLESAAKVAAEQADMVREMSFALNTEVDKEGTG